MLYEYLIHSHMSRHQWIIFYRQCMVITFTNRHDSVSWVLSHTFFLSCRYNIISNLYDTKYYFFYIEILTISFVNSNGHLSSTRDRWCIWIRFRNIEIYRLSRYFSFLRILFIDHYKSLFFSSFSRNNRIITFKYN